MSDSKHISDVEKNLIIPLILLNDTDAMLGKRGLLSLKECRSCSVDAFVRTSTSHLCLPENVISQLGLILLGRMQAQTAEGIRSVETFGWVRLNIEGGLDGVYRCISLPAGERPVVGRIPLENMGLELDVEHQILNRIPIRV